jgi:branched-chain amino acid transport system substrate-binding protein
VKTKVVLAACVVALAALTTGCGSDPDAESSASSGSSTTSLKSTVSGDPIVVGTICSCSGAQSAVLAKVSEANQAWAASVNASGGINGHPVKIITKDDAGEPAKGIAAAKELVKERVQAIVGTVSVTTSVWAKVVDEAGIPVVGGLPVEAPFMTDPNFYPSGVGLPIVTFGQMSIAKELGKENFGALYCAESPICAQLAPILEGLSKLVGIEVYTAKVSATAPNYTAPCLGLKNAGVDAAWVVHNSTVVDRVINACAQQNYTPQQVVSITTVGNDSLKNPNFEGTRVAAPNAFFTDDSIPAVKEFQDAVKAEMPDVIDTPLYNTQMLFAWAGGKLFEAAAAKAKLTSDSTPADVKKGLYALKEETLGGLSAPLTFTEGKPALPSCYFQGEIADNAFNATSSEPTCLDEEQLSAIGAALAG